MASTPWSYENYILNGATGGYVSMTSAFMYFLFF